MDSSETQHKENIVKALALEFYSVVLSPGFTTASWVNLSKLCSLFSLSSCISKMRICILNS